MGHQFSETFHKEIGEWDRRYRHKVRLFTEVGKVIESGQIIAIITDETNKCITEYIHFNGASSFVTDIMVESEAIHPKLYDGNLRLLKSIPLANAVSDNLVDLDDISHFDAVLTSPVTAKMEIHSNSRGDSSDIHYTDNDGNPGILFRLFDWGSFELLCDLGGSEQFIAEGTPLVKVVNRPHAERFSNKRKYEEAVIETECRLETLKRNETDFLKQQRESAENERDKVLADALIIKSAMETEQKRMSKEAIILDNRERAIDAALGAAEADVKKKLNDAEKQIQLIEEASKLKASKIIEEAEEVKGSELAKSAETLKAAEDAMTPEGLHAHLYTKFPRLVERPDSMRYLAA